MRFLVPALALFASAAHAAPAPLAACPIDRAIYRQAGNPETTAGFTRQKVRSNYASDLVFWLKSGKQQFWFSFSSPNGYGGTYITPQINPALVKPAADGETPDDRLPGANADDAGMMFDAFDAQVKAFDGPPQIGNKAPAWLFARGLGPLFHYAHNGTMYKLSAPVRIEIQMWRLAACSPTPNR